MEAETYNEVSNSAALENASFMQDRINPTALLEKTRLSLESKRKVLVTDQNGEIIQIEKQIGRPLANEEGVLRLMSLLESFVNKDIVQGNLQENPYYELKKIIRKDFTSYIVGQAPYWGIDDSDLEGVINLLVSTAHTFLTRLLGNKERESYNTMRSVETVTNNNVEQRPSRFPALTGNN